LPGRKVSRNFPRIVQRPLRLSAAILFTVFTALMTGCGGGQKIAPPPRLPNISGSIMLEGGGALPPTALLAVRLIDLSRQDPTRIVVEQLVSKPDAFPYRFRLYYTQSVIDYTGDYGIEVRITDAGRPVWAQAQPTPVLTKGRPEVVDIVLQRVR